MKSPQKARKREMSKQAMRDETERLVKEALERKNLTVKQGKTRIDSKCRKCGALNRVSAAQGQVRVPYICKEFGEEVGAIVAKMVGKPIMTPGYVTANFAIKAGYFFVEPLVLIFVGMLVLTAVHP